MHNVFKINAVYPHSRITARARKERAKRPKQRYIVAIFVFFELSNRWGVLRRTNPENSIGFNLGEESWLPGCIKGLKHSTSHGHSIGETFFVLIVHVGVIEASYCPPFETICWRMDGLLETEYQAKGSVVYKHKDGCLR